MIQNTFGRCFTCDSSRVMMSTSATTIATRVTIDRITYILRA